MSIAILAFFKEIEKESRNRPNFAETNAKPSRPVDKYRSIFKYLRCYAIFPRIGYSIRDMALPAHRIDENLSSEIRFYEN